MKTSLYTILCIVIRLGAVFWAAWIIAWLPEIYGFARASRSDAGSFQLLVFHYLGGLAIAFVLWLYPGILAKLVAGKSTREFFETSIDGGDIQYIALSVLGVWVALKGLGGLAFQISRWLAFLPSIPAREGIFALEGPAISAAATQLIFGIALALGAKGLTGWLRRLRYGKPRWEES